MRSASSAPWFSIVRLCVVLVVIATLLGLRAGDVSAQVLPRDANPYGKSYGEWSVAYWKWAFSIPLSQNPWANDNTGAFAGVGQSGPVWFLGGSLGNTVDRTFTMPSGKAIFMPVHQWIFGASVFDCEPTVPGVTCDVPTLQAAAATAVAAAYIVEVTIDGEPVANAGDYRALSPGGFSLTMPADNLPGLPAGTYSPQVSDGYWLMLAPLHVGEHTIQVHVASTLFGGFEYYNTYHITVEGRSRFETAILSSGQPGAAPTNAALDARRIAMERGAIRVSPQRDRNHTSWGSVKAFYR